jgi:hypothetical protein
MPRRLVPAPQRTSAPSRYTRKVERAYVAFDAIDGTHPLQDAVPDAYLLYPVRQLKAGKVIYFNFDLAKEMGLISENHPKDLTPELTQKILETFCLQIINEYDQTNKTKFAEETIKPNKYMATRYLQIQHSNKQGKTSGDGRSIWNGVATHKGVTWDISSRGTGVTALAPGAVLANRPVKTGDGQFGYSCGLADTDELYCSAMMSEIFVRQGIPTERVLTVIDLGNGAGIGARAAPNLLRPAHIFLYLKQGRHEQLKGMLDYYLDRQIENGIWQLKAGDYDKALSLISESFAKFAARLERQYVFVWMEWDGDNILGDAGIIDYGSVRQFGLRHDQYRYDDVERFSTNLNEQRGKARSLVQAYAQMFDFVKTKNRKPFEAFAQHPSVRAFDRAFDQNLRIEFLKQVGFSETTAAEVIKKSAKLVEELYQSFSVLERTKTKGKTQKLPDGFNRPAIFNMRSILRELPELFELKANCVPEDFISVTDFLELSKSGFAKRYDLKATDSLKAKVKSFSRSYFTLIKTVLESEKDASKTLREIRQQASLENAEGRITGNASQFVVEELLKCKKAGFTPAEAQKAMELFIESQAGQKKKATGKLVNLKSNVGRLYQKLVQIARDYQEEI